MKTGKNNGNMTYCRRGRPISSAFKEDALIEERIVVQIMSWLDMTYKDFWKVYREHADDFEVRPQEQQQEIGSNDSIYEPEGEMKVADNGTAYHVFKEWFSRRGLKIQRFIKLIGLINFRIVVVPQDAEVSVRCEGNEIPFSSCKKDTVQVFGMDTNTNTLSKKDILLSDKRMIIRKKRGSPNSEPPVSDDLPDAP